LVIDPAHQAQAANGFLRLGQDPIDHFVSLKLKENGLKPNPEGAQGAALSTPLI